ncbi:MAG: hypothetical protein NVSMB47_15690 [Polyangiales bacterium]
MGVELSWAERDLRALDRLAGEIVVCSMFDDDRPPRGVAGLIDWRLGGRLSRLSLERFVDGSDGELLLLPGRPRVPFDTVVVLGLGAREGFDETRYERALDRVLLVLDQLQVRRLTVELPGRHRGAIDAARAVQSRAARVAQGSRAPRTHVEAITLVDDAAAQRALLELARTRRR